MQMPFAVAVQKCLSNYVTFSGRAQRSEYWWFVLFTVLISVVALILDILLGLTSGIEGDGPIQIFAGLAVFLPALSATARRLHDLDRTGWWCLILVIPIIGSIVILVFTCMRGTDGTNRFGPDPLGTGNDPT